MNRKNVALSLIGGWLFVLLAGASQVVQSQPTASDAASDPVEVRLYV